MTDYDVIVIGAGGVPTTMGSGIIAAGLIEKYEL
jgi:hypothetical protein